MRRRLTPLLLNSSYQPIWIREFVDRPFSLECETNRRLDVLSAAISAMGAQARRKASGYNAA